MRELKDIMALASVLAPHDALVPAMEAHEAWCRERNRRNPPKRLTKAQLAELDERAREFFGDD